MLNKIVFRYDIHPDYIFELSNYPTDEFDSYILLIVLHALKHLKKDGVDVSKEISSIQWYMPCLLNKRQNDFYGLSQKIIEIYVSFLLENEKKQFASMLNPGENRKYLNSLILKEDSDNQHASDELVEEHSND